MERRAFLQLAGGIGGTIVLGGVRRSGRGRASAAGAAIPTVDRLVLTSVVDNVYDIFAKGGTVGAVTVQRTPLPSPPGARPTLLSEHGLAYHLGSVRGAERREILLDFAWTPQSLTTNYRVLAIDPAQADALIINSIRRLQSATGIDNVHAVVGGWHLAPAPEATVARTMAAFQAIDPDYLIPMHCTGFNTVTAIQREMPGKLILPSTGTRVVFGA